MLRRLAILVLVLIVLTTALDAALQASTGPAGPTRSGVTSGKAAASRPAPPPPTTARDGRVEAAIAAVQQAFNAGDVRLLCRPGALVDPAVIRQEAQSGGCESELETLVAEGPMRLEVRSVVTQPDLATARVQTADDSIVPVDLVRAGHRWLLSFSDGDDPMSALTG